MLSVSFAGRLSSFDAIIAPKSVAFTPPAVGRWRAKATYGGSRTFSPSAVGFSYLLVS